MNILFVNQSYWPDSVATSQVLLELAEELATRGHDVRVVSSRKAYVDGTELFAGQERHNGVTIHRVRGPGWGKRTGTKGRLGDSACFFWGALLRCILLPRPDVVVTLTSPPLVGMIGQFLQRWKGVAHVHWCMDLFPDLAVFWGLMREGSPLHRMSAFMAARYLCSAQAVVSLSAAMSEKITRYGVRRDRVHVIPVWADGRTLHPIDPRHNSFVRDHHLDGRFVVMYSGNLACGGDIDTILEALVLLRDDPDIVFVLISEGPRFEAFQAQAIHRGLRNVMCLPYQPKDRLSLSLSAGDVHLITNKKGVEGLREPCKVYGVLAVGRPFILIGGQCVASEIARKHGVGVTVEEGDTRGLVSALQQLKGDRAAWGRMCQTARAAFEREYDALPAIDAFERVVEDAVHSKRVSGLTRYDPVVQEDLVRGHYKQRTMAPTSSLRKGAAG